MTTNGKGKCLVAAMAALCLLGAGGGCRTTAPRTVDAEGRYLLDGFEEDYLWSLDSADNYGIVEYTDRNATEGALAMKLRFFDNGRGKTLFRREVRYDLSQARNLSLDIFNHSEKPGVRCALAFVNARNQWFETQAVPLAPGPHGGVMFDLGPQGWKEGTSVDAWMASKDAIVRILILVFPGENAEGALTVDNLRSDVGGVDIGGRPRVIQADTVPSALTCYRPVELTLSCTLSSLRRRTAAKGDTKPDELAPVDMQVRLVRPDGERRLIRGFLKERDDGADVVAYAARFFPDYVGRWQVSFGCEAHGRWYELGRADVECRWEEGRRGLVVVSPADRGAFAFASGERLYPIGQNVGWAADYEPYLETMRRYGGNLVRVWICAWNNPLLEPKDADTINLQSAAAIDQILATAAHKGIHVQLVLSYHGSLGEDWARNPFNKANGGPCALKPDFWVDGTAKKKFKRYLDYAVRRWAAQPNLFAWELMNEAGLTPRYDDEDIVNWHREMASYLKRIDPYGHLVTTSLGGENKVLARIWEIPEVDFVSHHVYDVDPEKVVNRSATVAESCHKPYWIQEMGRGWLAFHDQADPEGRHLHHGLWLSWMSTAGGLALPWWWDTHIEANRLEGHFAAVAAFDRGEDRRGQGYRTWNEEIRQKNGPVLRVQGLVNRGACYGFVYWPGFAKDPGTAAGKVFLEAGHRLTMSGLLDGEYAVEFWDTYTGKVVGNATLECRAGQFALPLPATDCDFAFKVFPVGSSDLKVRAE